MNTKWIPSLISALIASTSVNVQAREVRNNELLPFAKNFRCSNPKLQWQFDRLLTLGDENAKMRAKSSSPQKIILDASGVGGSVGLMYRGVTNSQFNESHILALIFNDSVAVSESRWLSSQIFQKSNLWTGTPQKHEFVPMRSSYRALPEDVKWKSFTEAFQQTSKDIKDLMSKDQFQEHIRIGSPLNATPQAIQFLTPHRSYAEGYGEYVLHVKEVVRRGVDVERYNYHNPDWSYTIGSIYIHDRDEYEVPVMIPSWDVDAVKVRNGTGWHQTNYGPALYFYTKVYEKENPCNVLGIRVDRADGGDNDDRRVPEGIILKCPQKNGSGCNSMLQGNFPASTFQRIKDVLKETQIDGHPVYYLPYNIYQSGNPEILKQMNVATLLSAFQYVKDDLKKDAQLWKEIIEKRFNEDIASSLKLMSKLSFLTDPRLRISFQQTLLAKTRAWMAAPDFKVTDDEIGPLVEWLNWIGVQASNPALDKIITGMIDSPKSRIIVLRDLIKLSAQNIPLALALKKLATTKAQSLVGLNPLQELQLYVTLQPKAAVNDALVDKTAKAVSFDPAAFVTGYFPIFSGDNEKAVEILERALSKANNFPAIYPLKDSMQLWTDIAETVQTTTRSASVLGLCIDYEIAKGKRTAFEISRIMTGIGLPADREIDTVRSLWSLAQDESQRDVGTKTLRFALVADGFRTLVFEPHMQKIDKAKVNDFQELILNYYSEFMSPPIPLISFSALNTVRRLGNNGSLIFEWPKDTDTKIKVGNSEITLSATEHKAILLQSLSTYYLNQLRNEMAQKKDPRDQKTIKDLIKKVIEGYRGVVISNLDQMISDANVASLMKERFIWNSYENTVSLIDFLASTAKDRTEKSQLSAASDKLAAKIPEMARTRRGSKDPQRPHFFTDENTQAWKDILESR